MGAVVDVFVSVPVDVGGSVIVTVGGKNYTVVKVNGTTYKASVSGLGYGNYTVNATLSNDSKYVDKR